MLAFTFGLAASRFDNRREIFQEEVNAIGTTYLRAAFLPDDHGSRVRALLRDYVEVRLGVVQPQIDLRYLIQRSEKLHNALWAEAVAAGRKTPNSPLAGLFVSSLNDVIDLHAKRVTAGLRARIPGTIWAALFFVSIVTMGGMGYHAGLSGTARSLVAPAMIACFAVTILLISDLDRPMEGLLRVDQQAMVELRDSIQRDAP